VSDGTPWQSPDGAPASSSPPPPAPSARPAVPKYGEYAPPTPVDGSAGATGSAGSAGFSGGDGVGGVPSSYPAPPVGGGQRGWTPPPKPGLIPLQPMTLGTILAGSFQVMRRNPRPTFGVSLLINGIVAVISLAAVGLSYYFGFDRLATASTTTFDDISAGSNALSLLSSFVTAAVGLVGSAILQGIISLEVARATIGEKLTARQLLRLAKGRIAVLIGWSVLVGAVVLVIVGVVVGIIVALAVADNGSGLGIIGAIVVGLLAVVAGIVLGFWFATRLSLVPSVLLIERVKLFPAVRRSWSLTTGYFWRTLGIQLLVNAMVATATQVIILPITFVLIISSVLTNPTGDLDAMSSTIFTTTIITTVVAALIGSVTAIIISATSSLIYVDLRMRKEGLDLTLVKYVEARQSGDVGTGPDGAPLDPYRPGATAPDASHTPNDSPWA
jgi:hypothetical protein